MAKPLMRLVMRAFLRLGVFSVVVISVVWVWMKVQPRPERMGAANTQVPEEEIAVEGPAVRVWTSRDGRTIKATYLSSTETGVTVRREDGLVFTIPLANLSEADATWVIKKSATIGLTQKQVDEIVAHFPVVPSLDGEVTNDLRQLYEKYQGMVKFIRPNTLEGSLKMIRSKIADDIKALSLIAGTSNGDGSGRRGSGHSAAAEANILSARRGLAWLEGPLVEHLHAYELLPTTLH
jgi:hypothetical protein